MKKTLVALSVAAFAASSAQAVTVINDNGTTVDFNGSLRLIMEKNSTKETFVTSTVVGNQTYQAGSVKKTNKSALKNAGSRFGVNVKHTLGEDFYALGRLEFRFDDSQTRDKFGRLYAKRAYLGLGSKQYGELTFGRQLTIADDLSQAADYEYGLISKGDYAQTAGTGVIRYDYRAIEGLHLGANYNFGQKHDEKGALLDPAVKNAYGVGALYAQDNYDVRFAYGHTNFETNSNTMKHRLDGYLASLGYTFGDFKLTGDFGYAHDKYDGDKTNKFYVSPGFQYQVVPTSKVYGNYLYERSKTDYASNVDAKSKKHGFLLGVDYKFHKQVVAFVEGKYVTTKDYTGANDKYTLNKKVVDKAIGVGMRVFW